MGALHISLLGGFEAHLGSGEALALKGRKTQALVAYLALSPGQPRAREELVGLLWSDRGEEQARSSLRQSLSELRKALSDARDTLLIASRDAVYLSGDALDVDVSEFERLINAGTPAALKRATELYRGDFLDGISIHEPAFEDWLRDERRCLRERACEALCKLLDLQAAEDTAQAIATARQLLALDPLREITHRALMRLYAKKGERTLALKQYHACRDILAAELAVSPEPETEQLADEIRTGTQGEEGAVASEPAEPRPRSEPLSLPDKPSIVVLPFTNISGDPDQEYFSDGITEDIITELSRFRSLFVIAHHSSFQYKGEAPKIQDVGRDLGVQYVVEGSVRKAGNRLRITAQLVEAETGNHLWAERYDRELADIFAVQDEVTGTVVSTLVGHLEAVGRERAMRKSADDLETYDLLLRADHCLEQGEMPDVLEARRLYEQAIARDPSSARAHAGLAATFLAELYSDWTTDPEQAGECALALAKKSVSLDELDSLAHVVLAEADMFVSSNFEQAEIEIEKARKLNPNLYWPSCSQTWLMALTGRADEGILCADRSFRLNPFAAYDCRIGHFAAAYSARRYEEALLALRSISAPRNQVNALLAACHAQLGLVSEARQAMADFLRVAAAEIADYPDKDLDRWRRYWARQFPFKDPADLDHLLDGLCKAGLPK